MKPMKTRLILVINPRSSGFERIQKKLISKIDSSLFDGEFITFEIQPTNPLSNAREMAKGLIDGDTILVAGGDGTAHIASNAVAISGKKQIKIKFTGFGNFNDYAHSFSKNTARATLDAIDSKKVVAKIHPLEIRINGEFFRFAPLYATIGLTAEACEIFDLPKVRGWLKKIKNRNIRLILSLVEAAKFYFKNRKQKNLAIKEIITSSSGVSKNIEACENLSKPSSKKQKTEHSIFEKFSFPAKTTDLVFMNGPRMARIMRAHINKTDSENFGFTAMNSGDLRSNFPFLTLGVLGKIPLKRVNYAKITFKKPSNITIQLEGEPAIIEDVKTLEVKVHDSEIQVL